MHPVAVIAIILGGAFVFWGGYEAVNTLYEWHNDRKEQREYEEYVRMHAEKGRYVPVTIFENEDEEEEDNEPLGVWKQKRDSLNSNSELRQRHVSQQQEEIHELPPKHELYEMERSISNRRSLLELENEILLKEEAELERKRELIRSKGNSITGVFHDDSDNEQDPFADSFIEQQMKCNLSSAASSIASIDRHVHLNNSPSPVTEQQQEQYNLIYHPRSAATDNKSDLGGSWSDLNDDMMEEDHHKRTDSGESFHHVTK